MKAALALTAAVGTIAAPLTAAEPTPSAQAVEIADAAVREPHTDVLVLGTAHLSQLPEGTDPVLFDPVVDRLAAWKPDLIAIEAIGGAQCDYLRTFAFAYEGTAESYCFDAASARAALGLDQAGAEEAIEKLLSEPADDRPPAQRRRLAALFLAAGDRASAVVQWLRLPADERHADAVLTEELTTVLAPQKRLNENVVIAATLAARLGLERVYPVDDHTGDRAGGSTEKDFWEVMSSIWDNPWVAVTRKEDQGWEDRFDGDPTPADALAYYRAMNEPALAERAVRGDFGAAAADDSADKVGRRYLAYWETRNLRMVANIREAAGPTPGIRVLAVVGASHKPYYERYLGMLSEMQVVDALEVLR